MASGRRKYFITVNFSLQNPVHLSPLAIASSESSERIQLKSHFIFLRLQFYGRFKLQWIMWVHSEFNKGSIRSGNQTEIPFSLELKEFLHEPVTKEQFGDDMIPSTCSTKGSAGVGKRTTRKYSSQTRHDIRIWYICTARDIKCDWIETICLIDSPLLVVAARKKEKTIGKPNSAKAEKEQRRSSSCVVF